MRRYRNDPDSLRRLRDAAFASRFAVRHPARNWHRDVWRTKQWTAPGYVKNPDTPPSAMKRRRKVWRWERDGNRFMATETIDPFDLGPFDRRVKR